MSGASFSGRAGGILAAVVGLSFIGGLILSVFSDSFARPSADADATSRSAIGHELFRRFLEERGWEVEVSRARTLERITLDDLLIMAEPRVEADEAARIETLAEVVENAGVALVVLPKRRGWSAKDHPGHIAGHGWRAETFAETTFEILGIEGEVVRTGRRSEEVEWERDFLDARPRIDELQLMRSTDLEPVVAAREGILLGVLETRGYGAIYVLADPDVLATHGISKPANAHFVDRLLQHVVDGELPIVIDESCHEIAGPESVWEELLGFPLILVTLTLLLLVALVVWTAFGQWGRIQRVRFGRERGKHELIENTAELLDLGQHAGHSLDRLLRFVRQDVARALHAPQTLDRERRRGWIENAARARGLKDELHAIEREVEVLRKRPERSNRGSVAIARRLFRWKEEMIHGSRTDSRDQ